MDIQIIEHMAMHPCTIMARMLMISLCSKDNTIMNLRRPIMGMARWVTWSTMIGTLSTIHSYQWLSSTTMISVSVITHMLVTVLRSMSTLMHTRTVHQKSLRMEAGKVTRNISSAWRKSRKDGNSSSIRGRNSKSIKSQLMHMGMSKKRSSIFHWITRISII